MQLSEEKVKSGLLICKEYSGDSREFGELVTRGAQLQSLLPNIPVPVVSS